MNVLFMGTPDFAVGTLEAIAAAGHQVVGVVTQPDKARGRGKELQFTPVKEAAPEKPAFSQGMTMPSFQMPKANPGAPTSSTVPRKDIQIPDFLKRR